MLTTQLPAHERAVVAVLKNELFRNVSGFTGANAKLNVDPDVLDTAFGSLLIHLPDITEAQQQINSALSQYTYVFAARCSKQTSKSERSSRWRRALRNHLHVGKASAEKQFILEAAITQLLVLVSSLHDSVTHLQASYECLQACQDETTQLLRSSSRAIASPVAAIATGAASTVPAATSLAGVFYNWHTMRLWEMAADKKKQNARSEMKSCTKIMKILYQDRPAVPDDLPKRDVALHKDWEQQIWMIGSQLD